jgi:hypothetical protein
MQARHQKDQEERSMSLSAQICPWRSYLMVDQYVWQMKYRHQQLRDFMLVSCRRNHTLEKRSMLKVVGAGSSKKQKMPMKSVVKDALQATIHDEKSEWEKLDVQQEQMEMEEMAETTTPPKSDPKHLTSL